MISNESLTKLRNAFAQLAVELAISQSDEAGEQQATALPFSNMTKDHWTNATALWLKHAADILASTPARDCPTCGSGRRRELFVSYDGHMFSECSDCTCWYVPRRIDVSVFERFFSICPDARTLSERMTRHRDTVEGRDADIARIGDYLDSLITFFPFSSAKVRYLDVGCGVGNSIRAAELRGWSALGLETDPVAVQCARDNGLAVERPRDARHSGGYHIISFWETLEHIHNPFEVLQECARLLENNGLLAITVPNLSTPSIRLLRGACPYVFGGYNTPGHINLFNVDSLKRLLDRIGFVVIDADSQYSNNPFELYSYLSGGTSGAMAFPPETCMDYALPHRVEAVLNSIWPGVQLLERVALAAPILKVIACRKPAAPALVKCTSKLRKARADDISRQAASLLAAETDYKALSEILQAEVDLRDSMLKRAQRKIDRLQGVRKRGRLRALKK